MQHLRRFLHWCIYANLIAGFFNAAYMVFVVYRPPDGSILPLWGTAPTLPHEWLVERRLYALEAWIIFGVLAIYFALTTFRTARAARAPEDPAEPHASVPSSS